MKKIIVSIIILLIGVVCLMGGKLAPSEVLPSGQLSEPFFFLLPIGSLLILIGLIALIVSLILIAKSKKRG